MLCCASCKRYVQFEIGVSLKFLSCYTKKVYRWNAVMMSSSSFFTYDFYVGCDCRTSSKQIEDGQKQPTQVIATNYYIAADGHTLCTLTGRRD